jgi:hypothetical protein
MDSDGRLRTATGNCATHGVVRAVKEMPRPSWPFVVYLGKLIAASRSPYRCPECNQPVRRS